ncbi:MAG: GTP cyclohydrolase I FolE [Fibrobacterota bacterium]
MIEVSIRSILEAVGENPDREGLVDTPQRVKKAYDYILGGYKINPSELLEKAIFTEKVNHMIIVKDIEIYSMCEHHMLPFFGRAHIGYISRDKVYGVSKLARVADAFSRRLQVQERLTQQIADTIRTPIDAEGVGVVIEAKHLCMMMRGVEKQNSVMVTSAMLGSFRTDQKVRDEFLKLIGK